MWSHREKGKPMDNKPCKNCGSYGGNVGCDVCGPPIREREARERLARTTCSALGAARTLARTAPTKTMTRAVAMSAMLDHCRVGEDVDQAASRILADALDNVTADLKTLLHVAEINRLGSHGTVARIAEKYTPNDPGVAPAPQDSAS